MVNPATINVIADGGIVTLTGAVNSWSERLAAADAAWAAPGTTYVQNNIAVS